MAAARGAQSDFASLPIGAKVFILVALLTLVTAGYYGLFYMSVEDSTRVAIAQETVLKGELVAAKKRQKEFLARREEVVGREALDRQHLRVPVASDDRYAPATAPARYSGSADPAPAGGRPYWLDPG